MLEHLSEGRGHISVSQSRAQAEDQAVKAYVLYLPVSQDAHSYAALEMWLISVDSSISSGIACRNLELTNWWVATDRYNNSHHSRATIM